MEKNDSQLELFDLQNVYLKGNHPTSTVIQSRLPAFCGVKKSTKKNVELVTIQNAYGTLTYEKNRLTQKHRDILDWVFSFHLEAMPNGDGSVTYWFNPYTMLKDFGQSKPNIEDLRNWIGEMRTATIAVETNKFYVETSIITESGYEKLNNNNQSWKFGEGDLYQITISKRFISFFENDLHIFYNKLLPDILKIESAEIRAIVRFLITQQKITKNLTELLYMVDAINDSQDKSNKYTLIRHIRNLFKDDYKVVIKDGKKVKVKNTDKDIINKIGIEIDEHDNISYKQHEHVYFRNPQKAVNNK